MNKSIPILFGVVLVVSFFAFALQAQAVHLTKAEMAQCLAGDRMGQPGGLVPCERYYDNPETTDIIECDHCTFCHFFYLLKNIIDWVLKFVVTSFAALMIIFGGFMLATSRGNPGQSQKGKDILIWTFAGLAVMFVGWMVVNSIFTGLGVVEWGGVRDGWWQFSCGI